MTIAVDLGRKAAKQKQTDIRSNISYGQADMPFVKAVAKVKIVLGFLT